MIKIRNKKVFFVLTMLFFFFGCIFKIWALVCVAVIVWLLWLLKRSALIIVGIKAKKRKSAIKTIALCPQCRELLLVTPTNQAPAYLSPDCEETPRDDMRDFLQRHSSGHIKFLEVIFGPWRRKELTKDLLAPSYVVAQHSGKLFLIKRHKEGFADPMRYELLENAPHEFRWRWLLIRLLL